jgi:SAM-dependent methyltransferase
VTAIMQIKSPVTNTYNVILEDDLICQLIIDAYKRDYNIDVSEYFEEINSVKIYKCLDTGYRFYFPFSLAGKSKLYEELQKRDGYYEIRLEHQVAETFFRANDLVLEIGCGNGFFLEKLQQRKILCTGLEFNEEAVRVGRDKGLSILNQDIAQHAKEYYESYDVVCSFQVLEHVSQVHDFIQASVNVLKPGGKLIFGVPNNNPFIYNYDKYHTLNLPPHHMGLWDTSSLANIQKFFGIRLNSILVEPLQEYEYEHYFKVKIQHLKSQSELLSRIVEAPLLYMRPTRIRQKLQKIIGRFSQGRNLLAVYTKI